VLPSPLTVHTIPEIFKEASFYERPRMKNIYVVEGRGGESEDERMLEMVKVGRLFIWGMQA